MESHKLVDAAEGTRVVGRDFERLTVFWLRAHGQDFEFIYDSTLRLGDGELALYGEGRFFDLLAPGGVTFPVVGGTGAYAGAGGTASFTATENEGEFLIVVDLGG